MSNHCDCDCEEHMRLFEEVALRGHLLRAAISIDDDRPSSIFLSMGTP